MAVEDVLPNFESCSLRLSMRPDYGYRPNAQSLITWSTGIGFEALLEERVEPFRPIIRHVHDDPCHSFDLLLGLAVRPTPEPARPIDGIRPADFLSRAGSLRNRFHHS